MSRIDVCFDCLEFSKAYVKFVYSIGPLNYLCMNSTNDIPLGSIVVKRAIHNWECLHINDPPSRVYNKTEIFKNENTSLVCCDKEKSISDSKTKSNNNLSNYLILLCCTMLLAI